MSLADRLKSRVTKTMARFSGEYSAVAPEPTNTAPEPERPRVVDETVTVTRARLKRPPGGPAEES